MKQNKFLSGAMALLLIAFCTISWVNKKNKYHKPNSNYNYRNL